LSGGQALKVVLPELRHDFSGFLALTKLHAQTRDCLFDEIQIDMGQVGWFDADMCAAFGASPCRKLTSFG
jgi:hypothetical protein